MSLYSGTLDLPPGTDAFLQSLPLFKGLSKEQVCQIAERMRRRSFASGVVLFHQDMPGLTLYLIEGGWVRIFSIGQTGQELTHSIFGPGDVFGELSLLDQKHHSATAVTLAPTAVWLLPRADLYDCMERFPSVNRAMMHLLVSRMRTVIGHSEAMTFQDVQGRLAYELLYLAEKHGSVVGGQIEINIPLTQGDLATMVGATRESVNKALAALRSRELVKVSGSHFSVGDLEGLRRILYERGR
ncbi:MAG TPA: Crp/Fnr family transcriptional regulator [Anaerolineales bacterium]